MQGLVQRFGDCWFFSGWNGFLLSYRGRKFLREYLSYERPETTHNRFWNVTRQFLNFGPFKLSKENTRTIISSVNQTVNAGASNYYAFKVLNRLFGNKISESKIKYHESGYFVYMTSCAILSAPNLSKLLWSCLNVKKSNSTF